MSSTFSQIHGCAGHETSGEPAGGDDRVLDRLIRAGEALDGSEDHAEHGMECHELTDGDLSGQHLMSAEPEQAECGESY